MTSPACTVKDGAGAPVSPTNGVDVTPGNTITIQLADLSADLWSITIVGQDELVAVPALTVDYTLKRATFTAPVAGSALILESKVDNGQDVNGNAVAAYTTRFGIYTLTSGSRVFATNERSEGSAAFGWITKLNRWARGLFGPSAASLVTPFCDSLSTTNATPTVFPLAQFACPDLTSIDVVVTVVGLKLATGDTFCQDYRARYYRNGGALTIIGAVIAGANPIATGGLATATATIVLSSNTVQVQVTGVAATNAHWSATMSVQQVQ